MRKEMKIVFLDTSTLGEVNALEKIEALGEYNVYETTTPEQRIERIKGHNIIITNKVVIDREVMEACPEIELICISATGINNIDLECAAERNIPVKNVAAYSTDSVAQVTFSMLLHLLNHTPYFDNYVKSGEYAKSPIFTNHGRSFWEIKGKQYGIIGLGTIGKQVAKIANAFGAKVVYYSTSGKNKNSSYPSLSLEELLKSSDIISIHCPLNDATLNLISYPELTLMKSSAYLLNAGRGKIVNEVDLAMALNENLIAGAGLDVLENEPINANNPLLQINEPEKLIITPHIGWVSQEARETLVMGIYNNIVNWSNQKIQYRKSEQSK